MKNYINIDLPKSEKQYFVEHLKLNEKVKKDSRKVKLLKKRTLNIALSITQEIEEIDFSELAISQYNKITNPAMQKLMRKYEFVMEGAKLDSRAFIDNLYSFYQSMAEEIKTNNQLELFIALLHLWTNRGITKHEKTNTQIIVDNIYESLLIEQVEHIANDIENLLIAVSTLGAPIFKNDPYPYIDEITYKISEEQFYLNGHGELRNKKSNLDIENEYKKQGFVNINSEMKIEELKHISRVYTNNVYAMLYFMNEYTLDLHITKPLEVNIYNLEFPRKWKSTELYKSSLQSRKYLLPSNGVTAVFKNAKSVNSILFKEIIKEDTFYMLYKMTTNKGEISGYYNTKTGLFYTALLDSNKIELGLSLENFVLETYYRLTVSNIDFTKKKLSVMLVVNDFKEADKIGYTMNQPIVQFFYEGGKPRNYLESAVTPKLRTYSRENYKEEKKAINGYIRKLPAGQNQSEDAVAYAKNLGIELNNDETFVKPFIKTVLKMK